MPAHRKKDKKDKVKQIKLTKLEFQQINKLLKERKVTFSAHVLNSFGLSNKVQ
jgi:hypothetical protein